MKVKGLSLPVTSVIAVVISVILLFLAYEITYPMILRYITSQCWADSYRNMKELGWEIKHMNAGESRNFLVSFGGCTGSVIIANRSDIAKTEYYDIFRDRCNFYRTYRSYILIIPWKVNQGLFMKEKSLWEKIKQKPKEWVRYYSNLKEMLIAKPECISLETNFEALEGNAFYMPEGIENEKKPNEGFVKECLSIHKDSATNGDVFFTLERTGLQKCDAGNKS